MENKKYVLMEVAEEHGCNLEDLKYDDIYCSLTDKICPMSEDKPCPHGKTAVEWAQKLEDNKDFQAIIDDKDVSYAEIAEVMIKALLGGEQK